MKKKDYIFGTHSEELNRLGYQHRVWLKETISAWEEAGIGKGATVIDLGSGPGFASIDLAYLVGDSGKVISVDKSSIFIEYLNNYAEGLSLNNVDGVLQDLQNFDLKSNIADFAYARWVFSWVKNPKGIIQRIDKSLKPGAKFIVQEYSNWDALAMEPSSSEFEAFYNAARKSFDLDEGDVNIGYKIPQYFNDLNYKIDSIKPLIKVGRPNSLTWNWISSFVDIYGKLLISRELLSEENYDAFKLKIKGLSDKNDAFFSTPQMIQIIATKQ
ncbi:methyltransferase domain-containing protein [Candidatus Kapabacteria bacterium]|nr:methyltransferase domain-containing protein [Candidatus Kapabacteria bacterium]